MPRAELAGKLTGGSKKGGSAGKEPLLGESVEVSTAGPASSSATNARRAHAESTGASIDTMCMACVDTGCDFQPMLLQRRPLGPSDVLIDMKYCGVCHSDLHHAAGHVNVGPMSAKYPCVPGHELAGTLPPPHRPYPVRDPRVLLRVQGRLWR
jgi:hypothetical protein